MTRPRESGFALLAAIWFVVLLGFVAVVITGWMHRSLGLAQRLQERLTAHTATVNAENQVAFRMITGFFSIRGLELPQGDELAAAMADPVPYIGVHYAPGGSYAALDGRSYRLGSVVVRLQDERGLYTLNHPGPWLGDLLRNYGVAYEDRGALVDRLRDYMDKSELHRLNGATAADYQDAGRPPPRNAPLLTPLEALRVLSWDAYPALWRGPDKISDLTVIGDMAQLNLNTAPAAILRTLPGMDDNRAEQVIKYRQRYIITSTDDIERAAGIYIPEDPFKFLNFPSGNLLVTILSAEEPRVHRLALRLTPVDRAPYRVDYVVDLPADDKAKAAAQATDLPALPGPDVPVSGATADASPR